MAQAKLSGASARRLVMGRQAGGGGGGGGAQKFGPELQPEADTRSAKRSDFVEWCVFAWF